MTTTHPESRGPRNSSDGATLADALLSALDEAAARELAERLRPHLPLDPTRFLDTREAAQVLGLHPDTLVRMARAGRISARKVGREWRFRADQLDIRPVAARAETVPPVRVRSARRASSRASIAAIRGRP